MRNPILANVRRRLGWALDRLLGQCLAPAALFAALIFAAPRRAGVVSFWGGKEMFRGCFAAKREHAEKTRAEARAGRKHKESETLGEALNAVFSSGFIDVPVDLIACLLAHLLVTFFALPAVGTEKPGEFPFGVMILAGIVLFYPFNYTGWLVRNFFAWKEKELLASRSFSRAEYYFVIAALVVLPFLAKVTGFAVAFFVAYHV